MYRKHFTKVDPHRFYPHPYPRPPIRPFAQLDESNGAVGINIDASLDINQLVDQIGKYIGAALTVSKANRCDITGGGIWISGVEDGKVYSALYHPSRVHRTSVRPGRDASVFPSSPQWVPAGKWAITYAHANFWGGNKAYYDLE